MDGGGVVGVCMFTYRMFSLPTSSQTHNGAVLFSACAARHRMFSFVKVVYGGRARPLAFAWCITKKVVVLLNGKSGFGGCAPYMGNKSLVCGGVQACVHCVKTHKLYFARAPIMTTHKRVKCVVWAA